MTKSPDELLEALSALTTAAESIWCAALMRQGSPSKAQWDDLNRSIQAANELLIETGYLCDVCGGGGREVEAEKECWKCVGSGKLVPGK